MSHISMKRNDDRNMAEYNLEINNNLISAKLEIISFSEERENRINFFYIFRFISEL